jgi:hypothetical protein
MIVFSHQDAQLRWQSLHEQVGEKHVSLLPPRAQLQHGSQELRRLSTAQGFHHVQQGDFLIISQLVSGQQPVFQYGMWLLLRRTLYHFQHAAHSVLRERVDQQVEANLLITDTVEQEPAFRKSEPTDWLVFPKHWQPEVSKPVAPV